MGSITQKIRDMNQEVEDDKTFKLLSKIRHARNGNKVQRFHTVNSFVTETVGHHSANMAILCVILSEYKPSASLLLAALTHDLAEQFTGDVPATAKWDSPDLVKALKSMEKKYERTWHSAPLTDYERRVLKQADMLDLCFKSLEEVRMGNPDFKPILRRGIEWLQANEPLPTTYSILKELQHVCK